MSAKPRIVIIGAGFGGIAMAKAFKQKAVDILLIDQNNYHNFQPLMYQVATGGLEPYSIAYPVRRIFRGRSNVKFRMARVEHIDRELKRVKTSIGDFAYDYLVLATGSETNFFNFEPIKDQLMTLKSIPDALNIRSFIFQNLEKALVKPANETLDEILSIAIVGGGPAGIEIAGALAEMKRYVIPKDFPDLDISKMKINLYEANGKLLKVMSEEASAKSLDYLLELGVNVHLNSRINSYDGDQLIDVEGHVFYTDTVIWTAGVKGSPIDGLPLESSVPGNRVLVDEFNKVKHTDAIFAIGDVACCITPENPRGLPMLAPVAQQQGKHLVKTILNLIGNKPLQPFVYKDRGTMATIGRKRAVVDLPNWKFQGAFAWFVWMFVHIMSLVGYRNKVVAFLDWAANYFTYDKPLGLIIRPFKRLP
ncbi:NADH dehydrogenase [Flavobacteriaceae bacterium MAR_2010_105]|nr:NADH dehydrogenase [Flavobacteriaceae bacterium MAR_2010_105]